MKNYLSNGPRRQQLLFALLSLYFAFLAFKAPTRDVSVGKYVGGWLIITAILVFVQGFQRSSAQDRSSARSNALITFLIGVMYVSAHWLRGSAIVWFMAVFFVIDALYQAHLFRTRPKGEFRAYRHLLAALGDTAIALAIFFFRGESLEWLVSVSGALRIAGSAVEILSTRPGVPEELAEDIHTALHLPDSKAMHEVTNRITREELERASIDRGWIIAFLLILFFMHLGRMGFDRSASGILSPTIALVGDVIIALIISFFIIMPMRSSLRGISRPIERRLWNWVLLKPKEQRQWYDLRWPIQAWLERRLRLSVRSRRAGYSLRSAVRTGLQTGLPFAALLATIIPVFGMSWYFDTENWAAGIWDGWSAARTDTWRKAMVASVEPKPNANSFKLQPPGVTDNGDFSFVVLGDPGEGDASQYILHNQLVRVCEKPDVKFMVISSDVVYPDGAMKDYERNFWTPMNGITKPVYAIPGNHDWYDALDGFAATFYSADAARKSMKARRNVDLKITSTTDQAIEDMISKADFYRNIYKVPTGFQSSPFFQIQTKDFVFITIETGVLRRIDETQMQWLKAVLEASKGKFIFALLGHPFYAIGEYQGSMNPDFEALHAMLRQYNARIIMAGDTHDLEYYQEPVSDTDSSKVIHHFVNGGGGAYLSLGAALKAPGDMPEKVWAHYPGREPLVQKIESQNNWVKKPFWKWTKLYNGWPFSAEWLSAAFDYNVAPFFQSFMEVKVELSKRQIRLLAYSQSGPLTWQELEKSGGVKPESAGDNDQVEWIVKMDQ